MTAFDTIFKNSCEQAGFGTYIFADNPDRATHAKYITKYPCAWRTLNEPLTPLYDNFNRVQRDLSVYFVELGFDKSTKEKINESIESMFDKFLVFRDLMQRSGIELTMNGAAQPSYMTTNFNEFGLIINLTAKYNLCLTVQE